MNNELMFLLHWCGLALQLSLWVYINGPLRGGTLVLAAARSQNCAQLWDVVRISAL